MRSEAPVNDYGHNYSSQKKDKMIINKKNSLGLGKMIFFHEAG